jgi:hypothetical protein
MHTAFLGSILPLTSRGGKVGDMSSETAGLNAHKSQDRRGWLGVPIWALAIVVALGTIPSIGTFGAGLISDDGAALGYVHRMGAMSDWLRPEYDLRTVRFWRPMVTLSLGIQEAWTGTSVIPLRIFNLACHLLMAVVAVGVARRLRIPVLGSVLIGACVALFPHQGGTVTWIVGRVDTQSVPMVLLAIYFALGRRMVLTSLFCFLAVATKEVGVVAPPAIVLFVSAVWLGNKDERRGSLGQELIALWPLYLTFALTIIWRRVALGTWAGGYPGGLTAAFETGPDGNPVITPGVIWGMLEAASLSLGWHLIAGAASLITGLFLGMKFGWQVAQRRALWLFGAGFLCCVGSMLPLATLLAEGPVSGEHERTMLMADTMLLFGIGSLFVAVAGIGTWLRHLPTCLLLVLVGHRGYNAWVDTHDWANAGNFAEYLVSQVGLAMEGTPPSTLPVLTSSPPRVTDELAYILQWGVADRFRAPFAESPRPIWPWRAIWPGQEMDRNSVTPPFKQLRWQFGEQPRTVPLLRVSLDGGDGSPVTELHLTTALLDEEGPLLLVEGTFPGARFEALVFTELGYAIGLHGGPKQYGPMDAKAGTSAPFGGPISLRSLLTMQPMGTGTGGVALWEAISLCADFGATEAYMELRAADDARGVKDRAVGASQWIHLTWDKELRDMLLPLDSF